MLASGVLAALLLRSACRKACVLLVCACTPAMVLWVEICEVSGVVVVLLVSGGVGVCCVWDGG